jgi:hypothetical protein
VRLSAELRRRRLEQTHALVLWRNVVLAAVDVELPLAAFAIDPTPRAAIRPASAPNRGRSQRRQRRRRRGR